MPAGRWRIDRLMDDIAVLGRRGLPREHYFVEVASRLRRTIDCDATCWHTLDPQTRLITSDASQELISSGVYTPDTVSLAGAQIIASEYFVRDVNTFSSLAGRRTPVGILSQATKGRPERSTRYRELLAPSGIPFEMRAAFVSRGRCWGAVHIARREDSRDFTAEDATALARVSSAIADGIRASLRIDAARQAPDGSGPGLVVLSAGNEVELITPPARALLAAMSGAAGGGGDQPPPTAILALAGFARRHAPDLDRDTGTVAVPTASGWITLHASLPEGQAEGRVAIVLERTASPQATAVRLEAHGVTPREREIATLIARGLTNSDIAEALVLSLYTVQDHIKSLFEKTGVASRQELVAQIFIDDYMPQVAGRAPLSASGGFAA
ncbi:MAG TPA: helix-turn-helix transcriptional regulator [Solirubrobacteraceae bacterium]|nr:helix-turn-helix transcriptional regulator [Solirubrobacteraceae bacterium]